MGHRTPIRKCRTWLQLPDFHGYLQPQTPSNPWHTGMCWFRRKDVSVEITVTEVCSKPENESWRREVCLSKEAPWENTLGGSAREERLKLANTDSVRTRQWTYLCVKLEDCNPNRSFSSHRGKYPARTHRCQQPLKGIRWQGCPQSRGADWRGHPACVSIPSFILTMSSMAHFHSLWMGGNAPSSPQGFCSLRLLHALTVSLKEEHSKTIKCCHKHSMHFLSQTFRLI